MECTQKSENRGYLYLQGFQNPSNSEAKGRISCWEKHMKAYATDIISSVLVKTSGSDRLYCHQKALPNGSWGLPGSSMRYQKTPGLSQQSAVIMIPFLLKGIWRRYLLSTKLSEALKAPVDQCFCNIKMFRWRFGWTFVPLRTSGNRKW